MKVVVLLASLMMAAPMSFAQNVQAEDSDVDYFELEVSSMPNDEAEELNAQMELQGNNDPGAEDVIGGIIGSILRPGRGGGGGGFRDVVCYARDRRGNTYRAAGPNPRRVQQRAMQKCQRNARFCRPLGCQGL